jgi:hypothetical protein
MISNSQPGTERKTDHPSGSVDTSTERDGRNHHYELSSEDREKVDAALAAITRIKASFDDWVIIGHFVLAARKHADRVGNRRTFQTILAEQRIMPPLDKATVSRVEKFMARLPDVVKWRATLTEAQRFAWSGPTSIVNHCDVFKLEKEKQRAATSPRPTRLDNALSSFNRKDQADDIVAVLTRGLTPHKQRRVMIGLVSKLGTAKERNAFGLTDDGQPAPAAHAPVTQGAPA